MTTTFDLRYEPRWAPYHMKNGDGFAGFWRNHLTGQTRNVLYVLGRGFDPRMCDGVEVIMALGGSGLRDCMLISFDEGASSPSNAHASLVDENESRLREKFEGRGLVDEKKIDMWSKDGLRNRRIGDRNAASVFKEIGDIIDYTDIVVDISAMPRGIFSPMVGKLLYILDKNASANTGEKNRNLHIVVSEDITVDRGIIDGGIDDVASYVHGFSEAMETEASSETPVVWIPILGEHQSAQLERIYTLVDPDEICPVVPWPSQNPRRGDELVMAYRELLFDRWRIEPGNIIYASEQNPFEAYQKIHEAARDYTAALSPLGGCKIALSAVSSKLLSLGAVLAAYELKGRQVRVGLAHVEPQGYTMASDAGHAMQPRRRNLFSLWLAGECYD